MKKLPKYFKHIGRSSYCCYRETERFDLHSPWMTSAVDEDLQSAISSIYFINGPKLLLTVTVNLYLAYFRLKFTAFLTKHRAKEEVY